MTNGQTLACPLLWLGLWLQRLIDVGACSCNLQLLHGSAAHLNSELKINVSDCDAAQTNVALTARSKVLCKVEVNNLLVFNFLHLPSIDFVVAHIV